MKHCQSCTLPLDDKNRGTEKDGVASNLYCKYCYRQGAFTDPAMTLKKMQQRATREMKKQGLQDKVIQHSLNMLPGLLRWRREVEL